MGWSNAGSAGSVVTSTASDQSEISFTVGASGISADLLAVLFVACDNFQTTDGDEGAVTGVTDDEGNSWTKAVEFCNGDGAAQAGCTISIWYSHITTTLSSGQAITASLSNSSARDATVAACHLFSVAEGSRIAVEATNTLAADGAVNPGPLDATTANAEHLRIRAVARQTNVSNFSSATAGWSGGFSQGLSGTANTGSVSASIQLYGEYHISTGTGDTSNPQYLFFSFDQASAYVAFKEIPAQSTWHRHLSEPQRFRLSVPANCQQASIYQPDLDAIAAAARVPESFKGWFTPLSQPLSLVTPRRLQTGIQLAYIDTLRAVLRRRISLGATHQGTVYLHGKHNTEADIGVKVRS